LERGGGGNWPVKEIDSILRKSLNRVGGKRGGTNSKKGSCLTTCGKKAGEEGDYRREEGGAPSSARKLCWKAAGEKVETPGKKGF